MSWSEELRTLVKNKLIDPFRFREKALSRKIAFCLMLQFLIGISREGKALRK